MHVLVIGLEMDNKVRQLELQWQTRTLATFIANIAPHPKTAEALLKAVERIHLVDDGEIRTADTSSESDARTLEEIMEHGNVEAALQKNAMRKGPGLPFM